VNESRLRGQHRAELAQQLADRRRVQRFTITVLDLAFDIERRPSTVRRLLTEAGVRDRRLLIGFEDAEITAALIGRFRLRVSVWQMHVDTGIDERVIRDRLRQAGVELEKRSSRDDLTVPVSRLVELYAAGWSLADLAVQSGGSYGMVRRVLLEAGVQFRLRGGRS
jgi:hypothetical protein